MSKHIEVQLTPEESLAFTKEVSYWDGFAAGAKAAGEHAKQAAIQRIVDSRRAVAPAPAPVESEAPGA